MSQTDAQILESYKLARDQLVTAIASNEHVKRILIRGREVEVADPVAMLRTVEEQIRYYEQLIAAKAGTSSRNLARLRRV